MNTHISLAFSVPQSQALVYPNTGFMGMKVLHVSYYS